MLLMGSYNNWRNVNEYGIDIPDVKILLILLVDNGIVAM